MITMGYESDRDLLFFREKVEIDGNRWALPNDLFDGSDGCRRPSQFQKSVHTPHHKIGHKWRTLAYFELITSWDHLLASQIRTDVGNFWCRLVPNQYGHASLRFSNTNVKYDLYTLQRTGGRLFIDLQHASETDFRFFGWRSQVTRIRCHAALIFQVRFCCWLSFSIYKICAPNDGTKTDISWDFVLQLVHDVPVAVTLSNGGTCTQ